MWARRLLLPLPTCEFNVTISRTKGPGPGSDFWSFLQLNVCDRNIDAVIGCWLCAGWSSQYFCMRHLYRQTLGHAVALLYNAAKRFTPKCQIDNTFGEFNDSEVIYNELDSPLICAGRGRIPKFRVTESISLLVAVYLLNFEFEGNFGFQGNSLIEKCILFEFCRHSFLLSRFLQKYFKYFKGCGVRI